ncbi:hypothetical protein LSUE1_G003910 [Lachnellula suecica]|uniref:Coagulation factor 5/8 type domain-containing protein n=1 Tax=Lachnellula suecica TaxID=602035 RepID=A0A8T9CD99_9HELO|nr:hypothetical protein LSUE1_G003910 [Lachnellula suecica]
MKSYTLAAALGLLFHCASAAPSATTSGIRSIYAFKDVLKSNTTALKTSGFNSIIMFGVGVIDNGDIMYYSNTPGSSDVLIASNGSYVGGSALADKVLSFKTGTTGINRVEISMNAQHIADLVKTPGTGSATRLYRNFAALKTAWSLDAVNNDDEAIYDVSSTVAFAKMLGVIGYNYTTAPYTNQNFWITVKKQLGTLQDRTYLQCYDGGASNAPKNWEIALGMPVIPLVWVTNDSKPDQSTTSAQAQTKFAGWNTPGVLAGGGYWNDFDIEKLGSSYIAPSENLSPDCCRARASIVQRTFLANVQLKHESGLIILEE